MSIVPVLDKEPKLRKYTVTLYLTQVPKEIDIEYELRQGDLEEIDRFVNDLEVRDTTDE